LRGFVVKSNRYLGSSWDLINKVKNLSFPKNTEVQLCSGDVFTMYPKVDLNEVMLLLKEKVGFILPEADCRWRKFFCKIAYWVLFFNYTQFDNSYWLQKSGLPMGSSASPDLCNLYMDHLESEIEAKLDSVLSEFVCWNRFIDDIFCIHVGPLSSLTYFCNLYNSSKVNIKVNFSVSPYSVNFLDVNFFIKRHGSGDCTLEWRPFQKPSNAFLYTPHTSFHKKSWKENWIVGNLISYARNLSRRKYFIEMASKFYGCLQKRGFTPTLLNEFFEFVEWGGRGCEALLSPLRFSKVVNLKESVTPYISFYNPTFSKVPFLKLLTASPFWREIQSSPFKDILGNILVAHRREKNIIEFLTRAQFSNTFYGNFPSTQEDINLISNLGLY
jgi:hypothetical protein